MMQVSRKDAFSIQLLQILDAVLIFGAFMVAGVLSDPMRTLLGWSEVNEEALGPMNWVILIIVPFTPLVLERFGFYYRPSRKSLRQALAQLVYSLVLMAVVVGLIGIFGKLLDPRRAVIGLSGMLIFATLLARDRLLKRWLMQRLRDENLKERIIIAGAENEIDDFLAELDPDTLDRWRIVSRFDLSVLTVEELYTMIKRESIERVVFVAKHTHFDKVARAVEACELQGVEAWIAASFIRTQVARPVFDSIGQKPMLVLRSTPELSWELMLKQCFDWVGALILLIASVPFWVVAAVGIKLSSPGAPVLYFQQRAGRYGKPFKMWKFRTMVPNAEALLQRTKASHGNEMDGPVFKLDHDPRVFPFGAFLRKFSIDELPQLVNVLRGEISLVGPRPLPVYEVNAFSELTHRRRLSMKPGITCEWQAGGRNSITSFEEWVEMDLRYIDNWSLWLDFKILVKTVPAVLLGRGAK